MDNQHRKISGYRELSQHEIDLMNEIKAKGKELGDLIEKVRLAIPDSTEYMASRAASMAEYGAHRFPNRHHEAGARRCATDRWFLIGAPT